MHTCPEQSNRKTKIKYHPVGILKNLIEQNQYHIRKTVERVKLITPNTQISSRSPDMGQALQ